MILHNSIHEINITQWKELVSNSPNATFFQTPECYRFFASLSFMEAFVYGISENDRLVGIICGYIISNGNIIKQFFSRRAIVPGGVMVSSDISNDAISVLFTKVIQELSKKAIYIEMRNYVDYSLYKNTIENTGFKYLPHLNFHVSTTNIESANAKLSSSKRRQIKQTLRADATIVKAKNTKDVHEFYTILLELYSERVKMPLFPLEFFEKLIKLPEADILLIKLENKVIGGICCVFLDHRTVSEWFVCGDDARVHRNVYPSVLATWAGIEYAAQNGFQKFDFMGAGKPDQDYGVREFKSKFGGELVEYGRFLYLCNPKLYKLGKYIVSKIKSH